MLIFDVAAQDINENMVVKTVKASLDITFNGLQDARKSDFDFRERCVIGTLWTEAVGIARKCGFINCFQKHEVSRLV